jgi:hypothetical protein
VALLADAIFALAMALAIIATVIAIVGCLVYIMFLLKLNVEKAIVDR